MEIVHREPIDEIAQLDLPYKKDIVVTDSITKYIWGITDCDPMTDIDATVSWGNIQALDERSDFHKEQIVVGISKKGIERTIVARRDESNRFDFHRWHFSMLRWNRTGLGRVYFDEMLEMSYPDPHTGTRVLLPQYLPLFKLETGRNKDVHTVEETRAFLAERGIEEPKETVRTKNRKLY